MKAKQIGALLLAGTLVMSDTGVSVYAASVKNSISTEIEESKIQTADMEQGEDDNTLKKIQTADMDESDAAIDEEATGETIDGLEYEIKEGYVVINGYTGTKSAVSIPKQIAGFDVTQIRSEAFVGNTVIQQLEIPDTVTYIGYAACRNCTSLQKLIIGKGVSEWGDYWGNSSVFAGCTRLSNVTIKNGVSSIPNNAFSGCTLLQNISIPESVASVGEGAFQNCTLLSKATVYGSIGANAFNNCTALSKIYLKDGVTSIGNGAFASCSSLENITLTNELSSIGNEAFISCTKLKAIDIPNSVASVGYNAFKNCTQLATLVLGSGISTWDLYWGDSYAFSGCTNLSKVTVKNGVNAIPTGAFNGCTKLSTITLPATVSSIGGSAFYGCTALKSVKFAKSSKLDTIGDNAFNGCIRLAECAIQPNVNYIGRESFRGTLITSAVIPDACNTLGYAAFANCIKLKSVTLGSGLTSWGMNWGSSEAFSGCTALTSVKIKSGVTTVGSNAFKGCTKLKSIDVPLTVTAVEEGAFNGCTALETVKISRGTIAGYAFKECTKLKNVSLGKITAIGRESFNGCTSLANIKIPSTVTSIDAEAFRNCTSLKSIDIPDSVTYVGASAFDSCTSLATATIGNNVSNWATSWGNNSAFANCSSLYQVKFKSGAISVGNGMFYNCTKLNRVYIPDSVLYMNGSDIFGNDKAVTIYTKKDSTAYNYAKANGIKYSTGKFTMKNMMNQASATVASAKVVYDGKTKKPSVKVTYAGKTLKKGTDYTVTYKNNKNIGTATVEINGKGKYAGTITKKFSIIPGKVSGIKRKSRTNKTLTLTWKKVNGASGYQIYVYNKSKKKYVLEKTVSQTTNGTIKKLKSNTSYKIQIRAYTKKGSSRVYGDFSSVFTTATQK